MTKAKDLVEYRVPLQHSDICPNRIYKEKCLLDKRPVIYSKRNTNVAVCAAIFDSDGYLLLTRRFARMMFFPKAWVLPGGGVELHESLETSLIREVLEETGINITPLKKDPSKYQYNEKPCEVSPFYAFESCSYQSEEEPAKSTHLILFYQVVIPQAHKDIPLWLQYTEVDKALWLHKSDLHKMLMSETGEEEKTMQGYELVDKSGMVRECEI